MSRENLNKRDAVSKAKEMIKVGKINIENGQVYNDATGDVFIDLQKKGKGISMIKICLFTECVTWELCI